MQCTQAQDIEIDTLTWNHHSNIYKTARSNNKEAIKRAVKYLVIIGCMYYDIISDSDVRPDGNVSIVVTYLKKYTHEQKSIISTFSGDSPKLGDHTYFFKNSNMDIDPEEFDYEKAIVDGLKLITVRVHDSIWTIEYID